MCDLDFVKVFGKDEDELSFYEMVVILYETYIHNILISYVSVINIISNVTYLYVTTKNSYVTYNINNSYVTKQEA